MIITLFGKPGAGKSTVLSWFVQRNKRKMIKYEKKVNKSKLYSKLSNSDNSHRWYNRLLINLLFGRKNFYDVIYSTDPTIQDTVPVDPKDLGKWKPIWNSCIIIEEAGIALNNRDYKSLSKESKRLAAMHRHSGCDILIA